MKKIIYSLFICLAFGFLACEDDTTMDTSKVTYFVDFEMLGDQTILLPLATTYSEPGVIATEGENDITSSIVVTGTVNSNKVGIYTIDYAATNVDGFSSSVQRTVVVYDPEITTDISGVYTAATGTYRLTKSTGAEIPYAGYNVTLTQLVPGIFSVSDFFAGYYEVRAGYGASYAMRGYIKLNADNSVELLSSQVAGWGDSLDNLTDGQYNPETGGLNWAAGYAGSMIFYIKLTK